MIKIQSVLSSRKFWALATSLTAVFAAYMQRAISGAELSTAIVAACAAYSISTGIEDSGKF